MRVFAETADAPLHSFSTIRVFHSFITETSFCFLRNRAPLYFRKKLDILASYFDTGRQKPHADIAFLRGAANTERWDADLRSVMKRLNGLKQWVGAFIFAVAVIAVYKTFDNFSDIWGSALRLLDILTPFVIGFGLAFLLYAPAAKLEGLFSRAKPRLIHAHARAFAVLIVYLVLAILFGLVLTFAAPALVKGLMDFVKAIPTYYKNALAMLEEWTHPGGLLEGFNVQEKVEEIYKYLSSYLTVENVTAYLSGIANFASSLLDVFMAVIISIYMLLSRESLLRALRAIAGLFLKQKPMALLSDYGHKSAKIFYNYLYSQALDALVVGVIVSIALAIIGVPNAIALGLMVGLMNMIPYFGAIIGGAICVLVTLLSGDWIRAIIVGLSILAIQQLDGNVLQPRIVSQSVGVRPIYVLLAITVGGGLFGFWGIFLAVPAMAIIQMLVVDYINYRERMTSSAEVPDAAEASTEPASSAAPDEAQQSE